MDMSKGDIFAQPASAEYSTGSDEKIAKLSLRKAVAIYATQPLERFTGAPRASVYTPNSLSV